MPKAILIHDSRRNYSDGTFVQIRIWQLPAATEERPHALKYSLFYGRAGERIVGYDNERGKGDHKHLRDIEIAYRFSTLDQLFADFRRDMAMMRNRK